MLGVANIRGNLLPTVDLKQFLEGERTVRHESQRVLIVRQPGGDVAVTIDELFGQRSFLEEQALAEDELPTSALVEGRSAQFVDRGYRQSVHAWGIFSLDRLALTPEISQAEARSEARSAGKELVRTSITQWSPYNKKKKNK